MVLYIAIGWLYLGTGLVVPFPWYFVMWIAWLGGLIVLSRVFRARPALTVLVPIGALVLWVTYVQVGSWLFGWSA